MNAKMKALKMSIDKIEKMLINDGHKMTGLMIEHLEKGLTNQRIEFLYEKSIEDLK